MVKSLIKVAIGVGALYVAKKVVYDKITNHAIQDVQDVFNEQLDDINRRLEILENVLKDIELGKQKLEDQQKRPLWAFAGRLPGRYRKCDDQR